MLKYLKLSKKSDIGIIVAMMLLSAFGLLMITSTTMGFATNDSLILIKTLVKQIGYIIISYCSMCVLSNIFSLDFLKDKMEIILIAFLFLLILPLAFKGGGGAKAWIFITLPIVGEVSFQPSEFVKIVAVLLVANYLGDVKSKRRDGFVYLKFPMIVLAVYSFIILFLQHDLGSLFVMLCMAVCAFMTCTNPIFHKYQKILLTVGIVGIGFVFFILSPLGTKLLEPFSDNYMIGRFLSAANPFLDRYGDGYQLINGLISFATGGLFGVGIGNSIRKYTDFPAANTDYILAIVVEELGLAGFLVIFIGYMFIIYRLISYAFKIKNQKAKAILVGLSMYFFVHFVLNVGGVTGLIPLTGVPLLMISAGGSSIMSCFMAVGIAQSLIIKYKKGEII